VLRELTIATKAAFMTSLRKILFGAVALGVVVAATPAGAQGWRDDGYRRGWRDRPPADEGGRYRNDYGVDAGVMDIAICPRGYHLGRSGRLCWPD
jgi:hypothetical protein